MSDDTARATSRILNLLARLIWEEKRLNAKARASAWREVSRLAASQAHEEEAGTIDTLAGEGECRG
jgi:hypothetical protein